jgi:RecJ-like exonuclease
MLYKKDGFMDVSMKLRNRDYELVEVLIPGKYEVCPHCDGKGTQVNPSVDGQGLSQEDFDQDPDFKEDYFNGVYDIPCLECHGQKVVPVPDLGRCTYAQKRMLVWTRQWTESEAQYRREVEAERRFGA